MEKRPMIVAYCLTVVMLLSAPVCAQQCAPSCFVSPTAWDKSSPAGCVENPSLVPVPPCAGQENVPVGVVAERAAGVVAGGYASRVVLSEVGHEVRAKVTQIGPVSEIPVYGEITAAVPVIGHAAGSVGVPSTLAQTPFLGPAVRSIPVVGNTIAGPPPPWLVGAVCTDTFIMPKFKPCGYTETSKFTMTDFNPPPRLRNYVNYLAPEPYTHPPIYKPAQMSLAKARPEGYTEVPGAVVRDPNAVSIEY